MNSNPCKFVLISGLIYLAAFTILFLPFSLAQDEKSEGIVTELKLQESTGTVVLVKDGKIYVDRGKMHGVVVGTVMQVYELEPITDMEGKLLETEENFAGTLRIVEVRKQLSIGEPQTTDKEFQRGFRVRFYPELLAKGDAEKDAAAKEICPDGMIFYSGGDFSYLQKGVSETAPEKFQEQTESVEAFCIDKQPSDQGRILWEEAVEYCASMGRELCMKSELRRACAATKAADKCTKETVDKGTIECEVEAVEEFDNFYEWGFEWQEEEGVIDRDAGSCSCIGGHPLCMRCYYPGCGQSKKKFRCCAKPL
ncbi:MAG: hypothetical protein AB1546_00145 [bacterium]